MSRSRFFLLAGIILLGFSFPIHGQNVIEWPPLEMQRDEALEITFNQPLDQSSLSEASFVVSQSETGQNPMPVTVVMGETPETVRILPPPEGWPEGVLFLSVTQAIRSQEGGTLKAPLQLRFTVTPGSREILRIMNEFLPLLDPNGPPEPSRFTLQEPHHLTRIATFHFPPPRVVGTIAVQSTDGKIYGPWQATGKPGPGGFPNTFWEVAPSVTLPPGTYQITVSHPSTWSFNEASGKRGLVIVEGYPAPERVPETDEMLRRKVLTQAAEALSSHDFEAFRKLLTAELQTEISGPPQVEEEELQAVSQALREAKPLKVTEGEALYEITVRDAKHPVTLRKEGEIWKIAQF